MQTAVSQISIRWTRIFFSFELSHQLNDPSKLWQTFIPLRVTVVSQSADSASTVQQDLLRNDNAKALLVSGRIQVRAR